MKVFSTVAAMLTLASAEPEPSHPLGSVGTYNYDGGNVRISGYYSPQAFGYSVHEPSSYQYISQGGLRYLHKREAEPSHPLGSVGTYNYEGGNVKISGYYSPQAYGYSVQEGHPGYVLPYQYVSLGGVRYLHKREAEPSHPLGSVGTYNYEGGNVKISGYYSPQAFGYSVHVPHSYQFISQGAPRYLHKREAEPSHPLGSVGTYNYEGGNVKISGYYSPQAFGYNVHQGHPGYAHSYQTISQGGLRYLH